MSRPPLCLAAVIATAQREAVAADTAKKNAPEQKSKGKKSKGGRSKKSVKKKRNSEARPSAKRRNGSRSPPGGVIPIPTQPLRFYQEQQLRQLADSDTYPEEEKDFPFCFASTKDLLQCCVLLYDAIPPGTRMTVDRVTFGKDMLWRYGNDKARAMLDFLVRYRRYNGALTEPASVDAILSDAHDRPPICNRRYRGPNLLSPQPGALIQSDVQALQHGLFWSFYWSKFAGRHPIAASEWPPELKALPSDAARQHCILANTLAFYELRHATVQSDRVEANSPIYDFHVLWLALILRMISKALDLPQDGIDLGGSTRKKPYCRCVVRLLPLTPPVAPITARPAAAPAAVVVAQQPQPQPQPPPLLGHTRHEKCGRALCLQLKRCIAAKSVPNFHGVVALFERVSLTPDERYRSQLKVKLPCPLCPKEFLLCKIDYMIPHLASAHASPFPSRPDGTCETYCMEVECTDCKRVFLPLREGPIPLVRHSCPRLPKFCDLCGMHLLGLSERKETDTKYSFFAHDRAAGWVPPPVAPSPKAPIQRCEILRVAVVISALSMGVSIRELNVFLEDMKWSDLVEHHCKGMDRTRPLEDHAFTVMHRLFLSHGAVQPWTTEPEEAVDEPSPPMAVGGNLSDGGHTFGFLRGNKRRRTDKVWCLHPPSATVDCKREARRCVMELDVIRAMCRQLSASESGIHGITSFLALCHPARRTASGSALSIEAALEFARLVASHGVLFQCSTQIRFSIADLAEWRAPLDQVKALIQGAKPDRKSTQTLHFLNAVACGFYSFK